MRMFIFACALAVAASPAPASASDGNSATLVRQIDVRDLDLTSAAGERALRHRLSDAVEALCSEAVGGGDGSADSKFAMMRCRKNAVRAARPQIDRLLASASFPTPESSG